MSDLFINRNSGIDGEFITNAVQEHFRVNVPRYTHYYNLYKGKHEIANKTVSDENKANNKLVNDFYGQTIDTIVGYFLGKPIVIHSTDSDVTSALSDVFKENDKDDLLMEVGKEMCIKGRSAVMVYQNEDAKTRLTRIPAENCIFVYDNIRTNELLYTIRVFTIKDGQDEYKYCEVYSKSDITYYKEYKDTFVLDTDRENPVNHIFNEVPIVLFVNNEEEQNDLEKIESLVNDFDKILSLTSDEHESFRNAYLMIRNMVLGTDTLQKLKEEGVIEVMEDGDVKFVTKTLQTDAVNSHLDRLKELIHKFSQVPDLSDEQFAGNLSGVAIKFKLFGLETKCIIKERKMTKALKNVIRLVSIPVGIANNLTINQNDIEIQFTRNIPDNVVELTDVVTKLQGTVDKETLLSLLPFIDNPTDVIERMEAESDIYSRDLGKSNTGFNEDVLFTGLGE